MAKKASTYDVGDPTTAGNWLLGGTSGGVVKRFLSDALRLLFSRHFAVEQRTGTAHTLVLADRFKLLQSTNASPVAFTVPNNSSVTYDIGDRIDFGQFGAGQLSFVAASGVTIRSADGKLKLRVIYSGGSLTKIGTNEWLLVGDLSA